MQVTPSNTILLPVCEPIHQAFDHTTATSPAPPHDPFSLVLPPFSTKLMVALVTPLPTHTHPNYHTSQKH